MHHTKKLSPMPTHKGTGKRDGAVRRLSKPVCFEQNCEMKGVCTQLFDWVRLLVHDEGGSWGVLTEPCSHSRGKTTCNEIIHGGSQNLLPVGKGLVKEGCDGGVAHASDSDRATEFGRRDRVKSVIAETLGEGKIAAGASRGIISHHTATFSKICSSCAEILKPLWVSF